MKPASLALQSLLASRQFFAADLYTFTLCGGSTLRYCAGDADITANGNTYPAGGQTGPYFDRKDNKSKCHWKIGVEVDTLSLDVLPGSALVNGVPFLSAARMGVFDGAELTLERAFMPNYGNTAAGTVVMFAGRIAEIDCGRSIATLQVNSHLELLNLSLPRNLYQAGCLNCLYDSGCGVSAAAALSAGKVGPGSTPSAIIMASLNAALNFGLATVSQAGWFDQGYVAFSGATVNAGFQRAVKSWDGTTLFLAAPLPRMPAAGESFAAYPGCDKSLTGCAKFGNTARFRGFPFIPVPETAA